MPCLLAASAMESSKRARALFPWDTSHLSGLSLPAAFGVTSSVGAWKSDFQLITLRMESSQWMDASTSRSFHRPCPRTKARGLVWAADWTLARSLMSSSPGMGKRFICSTRQGVSIMQGALSRPGSGCGAHALRRSVDHPGISLAHDRLAGALSRTSEIL